jgi:hypothetical protein
MLQFTKKPSSGSHSQYLAKITSLLQCRIDVVQTLSVLWRLVILAEHWLCLPDGGFFVNRNILEQPP